MTHQQQGVTHHKITHIRCDTGITQLQQCADLQKKKKKKQGVKRKECVREWIRMRGQRGLCQHRTCLTACSCCGSAGRTRFQILKSLCGCVLTIRPYHACYIQLASSRLWQVHNFFFLFVTSTSDCWLQIKSNKVEAKSILVETFLSSQHVLLQCRYIMARHPICLHGEHMADGN